MWKKSIVLVVYWNNLLHKLWGVSGMSLSVLSSYPSDRRQAVCKNGVLRPMRQLVYCGVPKGSILGQLIWKHFTRMRIRHILKFFAWFKRNVRVCIWRSIRTNKEVKFLDLIGDKKLMVQELSRVVYDCFKCSYFIFWITILFISMSY